MLGKGHTVNAARMIAAALTVGALTVGAVLAAAPAYAAGAPPLGLGDCKDDSPVGGWGVREVVATGTKATEPSPVRPRAIRLAEPCFTTLDGALNEPVLALPYSATEIPVAMLDADDDGHDDGEPEGTPGGDEGPVVTLDGRTVWYMGGVMTSTVSQQPWRWFMCFRITGPFTDNVNYVRAEWPTGFMSGLQNSNDVRTLCAAEFGGSTDSYVYQSWDTRVTPLTAPVRYGFWSNVTGTWVSVEDYSSATLGRDYYGGTQAADYIVGAGSPYAPESSSVTCATNYGGDQGVTTTTWGQVNSSGAGDSLPLRNEEGEVVGWSRNTQNPLMQIEASDCAYVVEVRLWVCIWVDYGPDAYSCTEFVWDADRWMEHGGYFEDGDPRETICQLHPDTEGCFDVLNPPYVDGADFDAVCGPGMPVLEVGYLTWMPDLIGHLARCLFIPVNGWDGEGKIEAAWNDSAAGQLGTLALVATDLDYLPGCGPLVDDSHGMTGVSINTCDWADWAPAVRDIAHWVLLLGFMFWAVAFVIDTTLSLPNRRTPNPVKGGD